MGDPFGMHLAHIMSSGMGGLRTAGDLVGWMQITRRMKIQEAKRYVAEKLAVEVLDLANEEVMRSVREDLGIGVITSVAGSPKGIRAKCRIAEILDIRINSVELFNRQLKR